MGRGEGRARQASLYISWLELGRFKENLLARLRGRIVVITTAAQATSIHLIVAEEVQAFLLSHSGVIFVSENVRRNVN